MLDFNKFEAEGVAAGQKQTEKTTSDIKWYKTKPGVIFLVVLSLIAFLVSLFLVFVTYYAVKIKLGGGADLQKKFAIETNAGEQARIDLKNYLRTDNVSFGKTDAPITVFAYYDLMCPVCARSNSDFVLMSEKYKEIVRVVYKNFPIESSHPGTMDLARLAMCAHEQNKFLEFKRALYAGQKYDADSVDLIVKSLKLDTKKFKLCSDENRYQGTVEADMAELAHLRLRGTPTFFVNGLRFEGVLTIEKWDQIIVNELRRLSGAQK
jgi:protein-disulfide isomerase